MIQTYNQKLSKYLNRIDTNDVTSSYDLGFLHELFMKPNIIVTDLPTGVFSLTDMTIDTTSIGLEQFGIAPKHVVMFYQISTFQMNSFDDFWTVFNENDIFIIYDVRSFSEGMKTIHTMRYTVIEEDCFIDFKNKRDANDRLKDIFASRDVERIKEYVNSGKFENDIACPEGTFKNFRECKQPITNNLVKRIE
jgi:hypothetical protein